ncbi:MAG: cytochrome c3 family protein, partial [Candidatus Marinimicrobia bacterium]|nr:cytochrome c3 family protein [Candidatus Neomarinimicrobiota bacterium]
MNTTLRMVRYLTPIFFLFEFIYCQDIKQPIQFNHQHHIEDVEYTCMDCHVNAKSKSRASIPNIDICEECHADMES